MKIVGILNWFDESPSWLSIATAGMGRICDEIIAVDGAYALYPGGRARSHPNQAEAILQAAETLEVGCIIHRPKTVWFGNEVEKRNYTLDLAGTLCSENDWLLVFDADLHMLMCNPSIIRGELGKTDARLATYTVLSGKDFMTDPHMALYVQQKAVDTEWTMRTRDIYRWNPTLRYGPLHWSVSIELDGERHYLRSPERFYDEPACDLNRSLVVYHRTDERPLIRREMAAGYYKNRDAARVERMEDIPQARQPSDVVGVSDPRSMLNEDRQVASCSHGREKGMVTDLAPMNGHVPHFCICCESLFLQEGDEQRYCPGCGGGLVWEPEGRAAVQA